MSRLEDSGLTVTDDKMLVQAVFAGEKGAYEKLYDRYAPLIRAICYDSTGNLADAQDLAQDVFMRAYEKLGSLRNQELFGKWLVGITRLCCREWRRKRLQGRDRYAKLDCAKAMISKPTSDGQAGELLAAITSLPEKERLALHTFYLQGKSAENARRIMGLSRSGFYRLLERARRKLGRLLVQEDIL